jgi:acetate CoA/acetoacetate CoA-transferase beta subunit
MDDNQMKNRIAQRIAKELKDGDVVNLGIGLPTLVANYIPKDVNVIFQAENGILGTGETTEKGKENLDIYNAGGDYVTIKPGACFFDSALSFCIIRGGHVDITVLGALEVDQDGNLANYIIPGKRVPGMGGAMDLVNGSRRVIIAMLHTANGQSKILRQCTLPLTAAKQVNMIVTERAVFHITKDGLILTEISPDFTLEEVLGATDAEVIISPYIKPMY